ncbi:MAG: hypothetical protein R3174_11315, partial [Gammaproteobacteria bacterium]|nr:hypothetical protein [Gammaproteobacteria bacterium]
TDGGPEAINRFGGIARAGVTLAGLASVAIWYAGTTELELNYRRALLDGDVAQLERSVNRLAWLGRDSAEARSQLAVLKAVNGDLQGALATVHAAAELHETPATWNTLGIIHERAGRLEQAIGATWQAVRLESPSEGLLNRLGSLLVRGVDEGGGARDAALAVTDRMLQRFEGVDARALRLGAIVYARAGDPGRAVDTARRGIEVAELQGDAVVADNLRSILGAMAAVGSP